MKTIKDLLNNDGRVYVYLRTRELQELFLHSAEAEGFTFTDGVKPTIRETDDIFALNNDLTINYVGFVGHMAFKIAVRVGDRQLIRVDYEKYIAGSADYIIRMPVEDDGAI